MDWPSLEFLLLLMVGTGGTNSNEAYKHAVLYPYKNAVIYLADTFMFPLSVAPVPVIANHTELTPELKAFERDLRTFSPKIRDITVAAEAEKVKTQQQMEQKTAEVAACNGQLTRKQHELNAKNAELSGQEVQLNQAYGSFAQAHAAAHQAQREYDEHQRAEKSNQDCHQRTNMGGLSGLFAKIIGCGCYLSFRPDRNNLRAAERTVNQTQARVRDFSHLVNHKRAERDHVQNEILNRELSEIQTETRRETEMVSTISSFYGHISTILNRSEHPQKVMEKVKSIELIVAPLEEISGALTTFIRDQLTGNDINAALRRVRQHIAILKEKLPRNPTFLLNPLMGICHNGFEA